MLNIAVGIAGVLGFLLSLILGIREIRKNTCRIKIDYVSLYRLDCYVTLLFPSNGKNVDLFADLSLTNRSQVACSINDIFVKVLNEGCLPSPDDYSFRVTPKYGLTVGEIKVTVNHSDPFPFMLQPYETKRIFLPFSTIEEREKICHLIRRYLRINRGVKRWGLQDVYVYMDTSHGKKAARNRFATNIEFSESVGWLCKKYPDIISKEEAKEMN